jgi:hypothetical protein
MQNEHRSLTRWKQLHDGNKRELDAFVQVVFNARVAERCLQFVEQCIGLG